MKREASRAIARIMRMKRVCFLLATVMRMIVNMLARRRPIACNFLPSLPSITCRFKTIEQLLEEQNQGKEKEEESKPIIFTDHTGKIDRQVDASNGFTLSSIDRKAIGFEVLIDLVHSNR